MLLNQNVMTTIRFHKRVVKFGIIGHLFYKLKKLVKFQNF